jgi:urease accessory protein
MITTTDHLARVGRLSAVASTAAGRTVLQALHSEGTLKAMRAHHLDPFVPAMAFLTIASPGGGVLQGDRLEIDVTVEAGAQLHVGTTSATRIYSMPHAAAEARTCLNVAGGAYVEHIPDPFIPYAGSRYAGCGRHVVAAGGTLVLTEVVGPGRQARGESLAYEYFASETEVRRPDGRLLFRDTVRLHRGERLLGTSRAIGSLYAISDGLDASVFNAALTHCDEKGILAGCSQLPNDAGSWFRVMAPDAPSAHDAINSAWAAARRRILGFGPPAARRY